MKLLVLSVTTAVAFIFTTGCCTSRKPVVWEYRVVQGFTTQSDLQEKLNQAGKVGFTIHSSTLMPVDPNRVPEIIVIMKRRQP